LRDVLLSLRQKLSDHLGLVHGRQLNRMRLGSPFSRLAAREIYCLLRIGAKFAGDDRGLQRCGPTLSHYLFEVTVTTAGKSSPAVGNSGRCE
jgi:hypothetical protein